MTRSKHQQEQKAVEEFLKHVEQSDRLYDNTADEEAGEDRYYYELDASIVGALVTFLKEG